MILRVTISRLRPHVHAAVLEPVRDQDDEVRLTLADRGLDRARVGLPVPEGLALEVLAAVVEELAQRGVPIRSDAVDRRLHRGDVGPDLRDHRAPALALRAVVRELHDPEPNTRHVVEQVFDDALGDAHLAVWAGEAQAAP